MNMDSVKKCQYFGNISRVKNANKVIYFRMYVRGFDISIQHKIVAENYAGNTMIDSILLTGNISNFLWNPHKI